MCVLGFLDAYPGVELLDQMVVLFLAFEETSTLFSIVPAPVGIPSNSVRGFPFPTFPPPLIICRRFDDGHSDPCEVVPHCNFD